MKTNAVVYEYKTSNIAERNMTGISRRYSAVAQLRSPVARNVLAKNKPTHMVARIMYRYNVPLKMDMHLRRGRA